MEVGAIEPGNHRSGIAQTQQRNNVFANLFCCCCRKRCNNGTLRQGVDKFAYSQVGRAKILTPLRNTMSFIDSD